MNKPQTATLLIACIAMLAVNFPYILPRYYKGFYHVVGSPTVSVRVPRDSSTLTVPVTNLNDTTSEPGQHVAVYLRNGYRDDEIQFAPRLTVSLLLSFGILYAIITRITTRLSTRTPK